MFFNLWHVHANNAHILENLDYEYRVASKKRNLLIIDQKIMR